MNSQLKKRPQIGKIKGTRVPLFKRVDEIINNGTSPTVTFYFNHDSGDPKKIVKQHQDLNDSFLKDKGRYRKSKDIVHDLHAIKNDLGAIGMSL